MCCGLADLLWSVVYENRAYLTLLAADVPTPCTIGSFLAVGVRVSTQLSELSKDPAELHQQDAG